MGITVCRRRNSNTVHPSPPPTSGSGSSSASGANNLNMHCEQCAANFTSPNNKKHMCNECRHTYCAACLIKIAKPQKGYICRKCHAFSSLPFKRESLMNLRIRDLKWFLDSRSISFEGCTEKGELVDLVMRCGNGNSPIFNPPQPPNINMPHDHCPIQPSAQVPLNHQHSPPTRQGSIILERQEMPRKELGKGSREGPDGHSQDSSPERNNVEASINESNISISSNRCGESSTNGTPMEDEFSVGREEADRIGEGETTSENLEGNEGWGGGAAVVNIEDIKDARKIEELSVRQLKLILTRNYIDYRGCCEKKDLQDRVRMLWLQRQTLGDTIVDENLCKLCMASAIDCVLLECGHMATCTTCGKRLPECPICRQYVTRVVHIFKA